jgi:hypothetical protein
MAQAALAGPEQFKRAYENAIASAAAEKERSIEVSSVPFDCGRPDEAEADVKALNADPYDIEVSQDRLVPLPNG